MGERVGVSLRWMWMDIWWGRYSWGGELRRGRRTRREQVGTHRLAVQGPDETVSLAILAGGYGCLGLNDRVNSSNCAILSEN